jgi:hypothetical protein
MLHPSPAWIEHTTVVGPRGCGCCWVVGVHGCILLSREPASPYPLHGSSNSKLSGVEVTVNCCCESNCSSHRARHCRVAGGRDLAPPQMTPPISVPQVVQMAPSPPVSSGPTTVIVSAFDLRRELFIVRLQASNCI